MTVLRPPWRFGKRGKMAILNWGTEEKWQNVLGTRRHKQF